MLVVEDDESVRAVVVQMLRGAGYAVVEADGGAAVVCILSEIEQPIHGIVTDVVMPDASGPEVADLVRGRFPIAPALFVTGYARDELLEQRVLEDPGTDLLLKPYTRDALLARLRALLDGAVVG